MTVVHQTQVLATPDDRVCLSDVLGAVTVELEELVVAGDRLQTLIGGLMTSVGGQIGAEMMAEAQMLDAMVQRLSAVSAFIGALRPALPSDWLVDPTSAAQGLPLNDSARRLACRVEEHSTSKVLSGDVDLF